MRDTFTAGGSDFIVEKIGTDLALVQALADASGADAMGLVTATPDPLTLLGRLKAIADAVGAQGPFVDGLEGLATTNNTLATALNGYVDQLEGYVDQVETLLTAVRDRLPAALGAQTASNSLSTTPSTDQDPIFDHANGARVAVTAAVANVITPPVGCKYLRVQSTTDCFVRTDATDPGDAAGSIRLLANVPETIPVVAGASGQVRVIRATADGVIYATPMKVR